MTHTYLFYDIETTGLNVAFDQVLQFAAIRTDENFNTISKHEIRIKLRDDIVPAPEAVLTHLIPPEIMQQGELEIDGIRKIHELMNTPNTISLGYNTLGFDDEFLRFCFYRNLLPPYTHQFANNCKRMDIFPITILFYLFGNSDITWPQLDGRVSLKLENLNKANKFAEGAAHDAMVDVRATVGLAKKLKQQEKMWNYTLDYFDKAIDATRQQKLDYAFSDTSFKQGILVNSNLGYRNNFQSFALCLGQHRHYKNQFCWLRLDLPELLLCDLGSITDNTWVIKKKLAEAPFALPTHERFLKYFDADKQTIIENNKVFLKQNPNILKTISDYYLDYKYPLVAKADADSVLYQIGFPSRKAEKLQRDFHQADVNDKLQLIDQFDNTETRELATRVLFRNYPESLDKKLKSAFADYKKNRFMAIDFRERVKLTPENALKRLYEIANEKKLDQKLFKSLEELYLKLHKE